MSKQTTYERRGSLGGYTIHEARTGWVIEYWSRYQGTRTGDRWLVPYGTRGLTRGADLSTIWDDTWTAGDVLSEAVSDYIKYDDEREYSHIRCLDRGTVLR